MKQTLTGLKGEIDSYAVIFGDFNTSLTIMDKMPKQKIGKDIVDLNNSINHLDQQTSIRHCNNSRIHILLKCTCSVLQDKPYVRTQNKAQ